MAHKVLSTGTSVSSRRKLVGPVSAQDQLSSLADAQPEPCLQESTIVAALVDLFQAFAAKEAQFGDVGVQRQVISPAALRRALHSCCEERFQLGMASLLDRRV